MTPIIRNLKDLIRLIQGMTKTPQLDLTPKASAPFTTTRTPTVIRANRIQKLSDQIFEAIEMPERLRVKPKVEELPPPPPEKPDNLKKHLEIRRRSSNISIMTMPELHRRVSLDVGDFLEGRRFSLESGLSGRLSLLTNKSSKKQLPKEISPLQMNVLAYPEMGPLIPKKRNSIQGESVKRLRRMSTALDLPQKSPLIGMNKEKVQALSTPRENLIVNLNDGSELCHFTKPWLSHKKLRALDREQFGLMNNVSLDLYDEFMSMGCQKRGAKLASFLGESNTLCDRRNTALISGMANLEQANYSLNVAKMQLWMSELTARDETESEENELENECGDSKGMEKHKKVYLMDF